MIQESKSLEHNLTVVHKNTHIPRHIMVLAIESFVSDPNQNIYRLAANHGMTGEYLLKMLTKYWFFKPVETGTVISLRSEVGNEIGDWPYIPNEIANPRNYKDRLPKQLKWSRWTDLQDEYLLANWKKKPYSEIAEHLGRPVNGCRERFYIIASFERRVEAAPHWYRSQVKPVLLRQVVKEKQEFYI